MLKKILFPKVVVYRNVVKNVNDILNVVKESQKNTNGFFIQKWEDWNNKGLSATISIYTQNKNEILKTNTSNIQEKVLKELEYAFWKVSEDYIKDWKDVGNWPYVKDWTFDKNKNFSQLIPTNQQVLMYDSNTNKRLAMNYHTDQHQYDADSNKNQLFITITFYLNDDYEEGELSFIREDTNEINYYKPKAGDITVFPSGMPYFHGVEPISNGKKYLIRTFIACKYEGSEQWNINKNLYGENVWSQMEKKRIEEEWNLSKWFRVPIFLDDDEENDYKIKNSHGNKIYFSYNKKEAKEKFLVRWDNEI